MHQERDTRQILHNLGVKADEHGLESLTAKERTILLPWFARGVIGNGGFRYFFEGGHDLAEVAGAFRELGRHAVASACERVGSRFAEQRPKDRMLMTLGTWLLFIYVATFQKLSAQGLVIVGQIGLGFGAVAFGLGAIRHAARIVWFRRVRAGISPSWVLRSVDELANAKQLAPLFGSKHVQSDALLVYVGAQRGVGYRGARSQTAVALAPGAAPSADD